MSTDSKQTGEVRVEGMGDMKDVPPEKNPGLVGGGPYTTRLSLRTSYPEPLPEREPVSDPES